MVWDKFKVWFSRPFREEMDAVQWFLFLGLLIAIVVAWRLIMAHIREFAD